MISYSVWIIDDESFIREGIVMALESTYAVRAFADAESALAEFEKDPPDLVLLDIGLPGMDGIEALSRIRALSSEASQTLVIMITAFEDVKSVIAAMKKGVHDYIIKPILMPTLRTTIHNALETIRLKKEIGSLQARYLEENMPCFIGRSQTIQNVMQFVSQVAQSPDTPILILGETGTGKELLAQAIHYRSPNFKGRFVTVNCAAIPKDLIESELFGYEKGAFSGASSAGKKGLIEAAENGTLFLDEIGDLIPEAQAKLLRFLEQGEFYRVGGTQKLRIQTRVISATNKNLEEMMKNDTFRKDLYFRLGVIRVLVPALNERKEDILPIAGHFLQEFNRKFARSFTGFTAQAEKALLERSWVGNIRELKNLVERGVLVGNGKKLDVGDLGIQKFGEPPPDSPESLLFPPFKASGIDLLALQEEMERHYILEALKHSGGNEAKAARLLNIKAHVLRYHRVKLNI